MRKKDRRKAIYRGLNRLTVWGGLTCIGLLAVPAAILILLICGIWNTADRITEKLEKKGE